MQRKWFGMIVWAAVLLQGCSIEKLYQLQQRRKPSPLEQMEFTELTKRYMEKDKTYPLEGIYSVSGSVTKKGKSFLSSTEKEKTSDYRENYAKVAIVHDARNTGREYIEISLDKEYQSSYSVIGEFNTASGGNLLVYKHFEGKNKSTSFTFAIDKGSDILEGIRTENEGGTVVTYKLTYVKLYPK